MENKENKENSIIDNLKGDMVMNLIGDFLPKIEPFIKPAITSLEEYFGDDEKLVVIKKSVSGIKVIILNNKVGNYNISSGENHEFKVEKESLISVLDMQEFIKSLLSGQLLANMSK